MGNNSELHGQPEHYRFHKSLSAVYLLSKDVVRDCSITDYHRDIEWQCSAERTFWLFFDALERESCYVFYRKITKWTQERTQTNNRCIGCFSTKEQPQRAKRKTTGECGKGWKITKNGCKSRKTTSGMFNRRCAFLHPPATAEQSQD
eukprot:256163-Amphidinium_carterae.1